MIEAAISEHIVDAIVAAYGVSEDQVYIDFPSAEMVYEKAQAISAGRKWIGTEKLTVWVNLGTEEQVDRVSFIRAFPRRNIELGGELCRQEYKSCTYADFLKVAHLKGLIFIIEYKHDIFEV